MDRGRVIELTGIYKMITAELFWWTPFMAAFSFRRTLVAS
jgi:hypothetical protein